MDSETREAHKPAWKVVAPNLVTATNLSLGSGSLLLTLSGRYDWAAWLIMLGVLLDKLDGTTARLLGTSSKFGVEFDSLADMTTFGVAPAALAFTFVAGHQPPIPQWSVTALGAACLFYVLASAIRLARFNVDAQAGGTGVYFGVTMPIGAAMLTSVMLLLMKYGHEVYEPWRLDVALLGSWRPPQWTYRWYFVLVAATAALMVSGLRMPKPKLTSSKVVNFYLLSNTVAVYTLVPLHLFPAYVVFASYQWVVVSTVYTFLPKGRAQRRMSFMETLRLPPAD